MTKEETRDARRISAGESAASLKFQIHLRPRCRVLIRFNYEKSSSAADLAAAALSSPSPAPTGPFLDIPLRHFIVEARIVSLSYPSRFPRLSIRATSNYIVITWCVYQTRAER